MQRRNFIRLTSTAAALGCLDAHLLLPQLACTNAKGLEMPRITSLRLQTAVSLAAMKTFYCDTIGLQFVSETGTELNLRSGQTAITFVKTDDPNIQPFYHFAFNIPENKILEACEWQQAKTPLIFPRPNARNEWHTKGHPDKVYNFRHWNAHSIFFLDPASNLVEYIARHDLLNASPEKGFSTKDILYASEIGFIVDAPDREAVRFEENLKLKPYIGGSSGFQPMGDQYGLLLLLQKGTVWTDTSTDGHATDVFETEIGIRLPEEKQAWNIPGYPYQIKMEG